MTHGKWMPVNEDERRPCSADGAARRRTRVILGLVLLGGCSREPSPEPAAGPSPLPSYGESLLAERHNKDQAFQNGSSSPIPQKHRSQFRALEYYPPDPSLRFRARLQRYPAPQSMRLATNTGEMRGALRYGWFDFRIGGKAYALQVYRTEDSQTTGAPSLFLPFRDATSGAETYAAGRYIDLPENTTGVYDLDFNRAYNPFCAYGGDFSCPFPPRENWLDVPIRAGEKNYSPGPDP